jgi:hypothetical protein
MSRRPEHERKRIIRDRAATVAATLLVLIVGLAGWRYYSERRLGRIVLTNRGVPLLVHVLPESGDLPLYEPIDVVTRSTLALPAGDYRLRVNGVGRLGQTYRLGVNQGETIAHELSLDEGRLLGCDLDPSRWGSGGERPREEPMPFALVTRALELTPGRSDIVELTGRAVLRRDAITGLPVWDTANPKTPYGPGRDPGPWVRRIGLHTRLIHVVEPAIDVDGDGTRDLLAVVGNENAFFALSGQDGAMLWNYAAALEGPGGPQPEGPSLSGQLKPTDREVALIGWPAIGDVDGDGTPDLIATMVFHELPAEFERRTGLVRIPRMPILSRRTVMAISGRSGRWLWTFPLDRSFTSIKARYWDRPAALLRGRSGALVAILDGSQGIVLDLATGRPLSGPIELGFEPVRPVQYAELNGDGELEILALEPESAPDQQSMTVFSIGTGKKEWTASIAAKYPLPHETNVYPEWPWLIDLDGDGRSEIVVPDSGPMPPTAGFRGVRVLDGASGQTRWVRPMRPETKAPDGLDRILEAPDLDGDGVRELVAVSRFDGRNPPATRYDPRSEPERVFVDAFSGRDGHPLWSWNVEFPYYKFTWIGAPRWWGRGPDGWPLLAVLLGGRDPGQPSVPIQAEYLNQAAVHVLEASTGRELNRVMGLSAVDVADLDGDGLIDLWGEADGQLRAFRGEVPEAWRALGAFAPAGKAGYPASGKMQRGAADFDGDGIADTLSGPLGFSGDSTSDETGSRTAIARSGRDGHALWKTVLDPPWLWFLPEPARSYYPAVFPLPEGDLDGDGTSDVIVQEYTQDETAIRRQPAALPIQLLSGRDGRHLWSAGRLPLGFEARGFSTVTWLEARVIEPSAPPDLLVRHRSPFLKASAKPAPPLPWPPARERLARVSGRTGHVVWDIPLEEQPSKPEPGAPQPPKIEDIDGDGKLDAAVIVRHPNPSGQSEFELKVFSLHDGVSRWTRVLPYQGFVAECPSVEIGKGGPNDSATVFVNELPTSSTSNELVVRALDGRNGTDRWTWRSGVAEGKQTLYGDIDAIALDRAEKDAICVTYSDLRRECKIVIVDARGKERARRVLPPEAVPTVYFPPVEDHMIDLDGDGRDELIVWNDDRLRAWGSDLTDRWSIPAKSWQILGVLPASPGHSSKLILPPMTAIDGLSGQFCSIHKPPASSNWYGGELLDPGDASRMPRLIIARNQTPGTVCRSLLPVTHGGDYVAPSGARPPDDLARDDPRWTRALPWMSLMAPATARAGLFAVVGLALVNVFLPLGILRLVSRGRRWSLRALMALPVAAAVPLSAFLALEPMIPIPKTPPPAPLPSSPMALFASGAVAGVPVVFYVVFAGWSLIRRRWRTLGLLAGFTIIASLAIAAVWLWVDIRDMPAIEHYSRSGWHVALLPGAYSVSSLMLCGWAVRGMSRRVRRRAMRAE